MRLAKKLDWNGFNLQIFLDISAGQKSYTFWKYIDKNKNKTENKYYELQLRSKWRVLPIDVQISLWQNSINYTQTDAHITLFKFANVEQTDSNF
jgi:hypothetical protein